MRRLVRTLRTGWLAVLLTGCAYAALAGDKEPQATERESTDLELAWHTVCPELA